MEHKRAKMPKSSKKNEGFHSSAGLIRYFDAEEDVALKINPWFVVAMCIVLSAVVIFATVVYPT